MPRKASEWREEFIQGLIDHMSQGHSFRSYSAKIQVPYSTMLKWAQTKKRFIRAKELAEASALLFHERERNAASLGQLKQVKKEKILKTSFLDEDGREVLDGEGKPAIKEQIIEREYGSTSFKEQSWIFIMKSRFGYTDYVAAPPGGNSDPDATPSDLTLAYPKEGAPFKIKDLTLNDQAIQVGEILQSSCDQK